MLTSNCSALGSAAGAGDDAAGATVARDGEFGLAPNGKRAIELAVDQARRLGQPYVATRLLLALTLLKDAPRSHQILRQMGSAPEQVYQTTLDALHTR